MIADPALTFTLSKDADDAAWYIVHSFDALASVDSVTPLLVQNGPGAIPPGVDLVADNAQINATDTRLASGRVIPATYGILFRLSFGRPGAIYSLRVKYTTLLMGNNLARNVFVNIAGV